MAKKESAISLELAVFTITGTSPLLQSNPINLISNTGADGLATKKTYVDEDEAAIRTYKTSKGEFYHPSEAFKRSMVRAVTGRKYGKDSAPAIIRGCVFPAEAECLLVDANGKPLKDYAIDRRTVNVGSGKAKAKVLRCRPVWHEWVIKLALELDAARVTSDQILQALQVAGCIVGIGDFRPEMGGSFGRFTAQLN